MDFTLEAHSVLLSMEKCAQLVLQSPSELISCGNLDIVFYEALLLTAVDRRQGVDSEEFLSPRWFAPVNHRGLGGGGDAGSLPGVLPP